GRKAFLHRFAAASAAVRYLAVHYREVEHIVALGIVLRRDDRNWFERLPGGIEQAVMLKLCYGHFLCHAFHLDYIVAKGHDCVALEHEMLELADVRGTEHPAELNVGHLYEAKPALADFYKKLDPCNCFNPGIGKTSKFPAHRGDEAEAVV
ncbi:D-lactate dehydrogenase, partial [Caballeronia sp. LZ002]|nr:D-lactate dehydrogenase [Caballeronia sp. LZ002]MDR5851994.1 D-lactate dehydrogenase [Caballeronia sp. LZ003]